MQAKAALNKVSCWKSKLWPDTLQSTVAGPPKSLAWESGKFQARFVHVQDLNVGNNSVLQNGCGQLSLKRTKWNAYKNCGHMFLVCDVICIDALICWHNFEDVWFSSFLWGTTWRKHCFSCRWMCQVFAVFFFFFIQGVFFWVGVEWGGVGCWRSFALASWTWCYVTNGKQRPWRAHNHPKRCSFLKLCLMTALHVWVRLFLRNWYVEKMKQKIRENCASESVFPTMFLA